MKSELWRRLEAVYASDLPTARKSVMAYLAFRANGNEWCWPSQETIAEAVGLDLRTVERHIAALSRAGWIREKCRRPGLPRGVQYRLFDVSFVTGPHPTPVAGERSHPTSASLTPDIGDGSHPTSVTGVIGSSNEVSGRASAAASPGEVCAQLGHDWATVGDRKWCRRCVAPRLEAVG